MKHPVLKRKRNRGDEPLFGLNRRVARKLGKSESLVSMMRRGVAASSKVADAIEETAPLMFEEWAHPRPAKRAKEASRA